MEEIVAKGSCMVCGRLWRTWGTSPSHARKALKFLLGDCCRGQLPPVEDAVNIEVLAGRVSPPAEEAV
jgi:hypothetical protein